MPRAFQLCEKISSVNFPEVTFASEYIFSGCKQLISADMPKLKRLTWCMFNDCPNLKTVNLPEVLHAAARSFNFCPSLTSIKLPNLKSISDSTFCDCENLTTVILSPSITFINSGRPFERCSNLQYIIIDDITPKEIVVDVEGIRNQLSPEFKDKVILRSQFLAINEALNTNLTDDENISYLPLSGL